MDIVQEEAFIVHRHSNPPLLFHQRANADLYIQNMYIKEFQQCKLMLEAYINRKKLNVTILLDEDLVEEWKEIGKLDETKYHIETVHDNGWESDVIEDTTVLRDLTVFDEIHMGYDSFLKYYEFIRERVDRIYLQEIDERTTVEQRFRHEPPTNYSINLYKFHYILHEEFNLHFHIETLMNKESMYDLVYLLSQQIDIFNPFRIIPTTFTDKSIEIVEI